MQFYCKGKVDDEIIDEITVQAPSVQAARTKALRNMELPDFSENIIIELTTKMAINERHNQLVG